MEAPAWLCKKLGEIAPFARLAWDGVRRRKDEVDPGSFALVELVPKLKVGSLDEPILPNELWYVTTRADKFGKAVQQKIDRGAIFNAKGGFVPDWDMLNYVPVYIARFRDYQIPWESTKANPSYFTNARVYHGAIIPLIHRWDSSTRQKRIEDSRKAKAKEVKDQLQAVSEEGTKFLWHEANKTGATTYSYVTKEERVAAHKEVLEKRVDFEDYYNGKKVFR